LYLLAISFMASHSILIVEDHIIIQKNLQAILELNGFVVFSAANGLEGMELLSKNTPDLIITDIMMPVMDGYTFMFRIRQDQKFDSVPVIMLTALEGAEDRIKGLEAGAVDFIVKPFSAKELLFKVRNILNLKNAVKTSHKDDRSPFQKKFDLFIEDHLTESPSLDQIAEQLQMSKSSLLRASKKHLQSTPYQYITKKRLLLAKEQIELGFYQLSEIAYKTGFSSPSHFTASFRKSFGKTPSEYFNELNKTKVD